MSLGIVIVSPSGVVLAADSRVTLTTAGAGGVAGFQVHYDNATKLLRFNDPNRFVGAVTFGMAVVPPGNRTADSYIPEFESQLGDTRLSVKDFAERLSAFFVGLWAPAVASGYTGDDMIFYVSGFDEDDPYGRSFKFGVPKAPTPVEEVAPGVFGALWGGQLEIADRLIQGFRTGLDSRISAALKLDAKQQALLKATLGAEGLQIPVDIMALQDCVNLAITLIRTTISMQQLAVTARNVGGPVDVVTITRTKGLQVVQFKEISGDED